MGGFPDSFCMTCGEEAHGTPENEGYSNCCNDRITSDPYEHPDHPDTLRSELDELKADGEGDTDEAREIRAKLDRYARQASRQSTYNRARAAGQHNARLHRGGC